MPQVKNVPLRRQLSDKEAACSSLAAELAGAKRAATAAEAALHQAHSAAAALQQQLVTAAAAMLPLQQVEVGIDKPYSSLVCKTLQMPAS